MQQPQPQVLQLGLLSLRLPSMRASGAKLPPLAVSLCGSRSLQFRC